MVDPSLQELANCKLFSAKLFAVVDAGKEEFIYSELKMLKHSSLDLGEVEQLMGLGLSCGKAIHELYL